MKVNEIAKIDLEEYLADLKKFLADHVKSHRQTTLEEFDKDA
jgi:hypothetical protein